MVRDETTSGEVLQQLALQLEAERVTVRELIVSRVEAEVRTHNARATAEPFRGLVQPEGERTGVGKSPKKKPKKRRRVDAARQVEIALGAFERGRVLVLVDDRQVTKLDQEVTLRPGSAVSFLKLTPLVGG